MKHDSAYPWNKASPWLLHHCSEPGQNFRSYVPSPQTPEAKVSSCSWLSPWGPIIPLESNGSRCYHSFSSQNTTARIFDPMEGSVPSGHAHRTHLPPCPGHHACKPASMVFIHVQPSQTKMWSWSSHHSRVISQAAAILLFMLEEEK